MCDPHPPKRTLLQAEPETGNKLIQKETMMKTLTFVIVSLAWIAAELAHSEPTTPSLMIQSIRPYNNQSAPGVVFLQLSQTSVCGTDVYKIDLSWSGSKELLATALSASLANRPVLIEVASCTGWGSIVQSLTLSNQ